MKIISLLGSRREAKSNTAELLNMFVQELQLLSPKETIEHSCYSPIDLKILDCIGCESCFKHGICKLDPKDSFVDIKQQINDSDVVMIGTPVYAGTVSGDLKRLIDRLSYWCHILPLIGKYGIPIVTASSNHLLETSGYLRRIMETWGLCIPFEICCTVDDPPMLRNDYFREQTLKQFALEFMVEFEKKSLGASGYQEKYFEALGRVYGSIEPSESVESAYWRDNGYFEFTNFNELLKSRRTS